MVALLIFISCALNAARAVGSRGAPVIPLAAAAAQVGAFRTADRWLPTAVPGTQQPPAVPALVFAPPAALLLIGSLL